MSNIDFNKFAKYSRPAPRYTSYPTAIEFKDLNFDEIKDFYNDNKPLSLYFHIPFCKSACYFCGCSVVYTSKEDKKVEYIEYLKKEMDLLAQNIDTNKEVIQLHFGGGTPTFLSPTQLEEILNYIHKTFPNFSNNAESSIEIDPRFFNEEQMKVLSKGGINRISFGVQDFDFNTQKAVNRVQSYEMTKNAVELARKYNIKSINIDLIYGLPYQNFNSFKETLNLVLSLDPDRLAVFNYAHVPWLKKSMRKIDETTLPNPSEKLKILKYTIDFFENNGYKMVGMDHFAKPTDELFKAIQKGELHRNFQGYTTKGGASLIGIGVTSIGETENAYIQNQKDLKLYQKSLDENKIPTFRGIILNDEDKLRKRVIMELMANFSLNIKRIEKEFNINFFDKFKTEIEDLEEFKNEELLTIDKNFIKVNKTGSMLIRNIALPFDEYYRKMSNKKAFSKSV